ncbi:hypothetical protein DENSPDRAFT_790836 [Dentipellis sp. KUC8613]|nr:hypothetical protein DENSPDRAFT_790836 [Dentipellis sp. KUC8613]
MASGSPWSHSPSSRRSYQQRASTAGYYQHPLPQPPVPPPIPPGLIPGNPHRASTAGGRIDGLFFIQQPTNYSVLTNGPQRPPPARQAPPILVPLSRTERPASTQPPPLPQKPPSFYRRNSSPVPPLPPKPFSPTSSSPSASAPRLSLYPQSIPGPIAFPHPQTFPIIEEKSPVSAVEDGQIERALQLSAIEDDERRQQRDTQDEDLAKALEESMILNGHPTESPSSASFVLSSHAASAAELASLPPGALPPDLRPHTTEPVYSHTRDPADDSFLSLRSTHSTQSQMQEDEALARRLAVEDDRRTISSEAHSHESDTAPYNNRQSSSVSLYPDTISGAHYSPQQARKSLSASSSSSHENTSAIQRSPVLTHSREPPPSLRRASSNDFLSAPSEFSSIRTGSPRPTASSAPTSSIAEEDEDEEVAEAPRLSLTPNQFVEPELLTGVSFGFAPPSIGVSQTMMRDPVPTVIALPYGKCPPMHIQAPSWRHLLKLMAKLSATRIQPSIEALAVTKSDLKLRTVVQFVKVHHSSAEWRTILYLTIEYPVPPSHPNYHKYTNGDVSTLPYSYALSSLPATLRDGADSSMAKYYTIPQTSSTPLPSLPIDLPSMAMYLASALEDSRRALNDSSSGLRKLAKMVDQFYPDNNPSGELGGDSTERLATRRFLGRFVRRGNKSKDNRGGNADRYELVTPFVPDEWG